MKITNNFASTIIGTVSGRITYNGRTINIPQSSRMELVDGQILIDGKPFEQYKLAGNSIVVSCLYHVFRKMFIDHSNEQKGYVQLSLF